MTKASSEIKLSTGRYGSVESTALYPATAAADDSTQQHALTHKAFTD